MGNGPKVKGRRLAPGRNQPGTQNIVRRLRPNGAIIVNNSNPRILDVPRQDPG
jgi:hypothetical protein